MSGIPYIRFYGNDWLSGTQELSLEERGALTTIIALTSTTGSPPAADYARLAKRFGCTPGRAKKVIRSLIDLRKVSVVDGALHNRRAMLETEISQKTSQKQSENASARWPKKSEKCSENKGHVDAMAVPWQCQPEPEPEPYISNAAGGSAREREVEILPSQSPTFREQILDAIGVDKSGLTGRGSKMLGSQSDMAEVARWLALPGLTEAVVLAEVRVVISKKLDGPPSTFRFFTNAMERLSGSLTLPPLTPIQTFKGVSPNERNRQASAAVTEFARRVGAGEIDLDAGRDDPFKRPRAAGGCRSADN
jgi:uncharacterized protein YdaU (DUF1376 family)